MSAMAVPSTPAWLTHRGGSLKPGIREGIVFVMLGGQPQYRCDVRPAKGAFECNVIQTINGRFIGAAQTYPTAAAAFSGGLEKLRDAMGW
ncbi:MAG: hypothetical protein LC104_01680 [Bacteroidales bacterium]|nr:hypothetical protein [Bacteroidales bacterium]